MVDFDPIFVQWSKEKMLEFCKQCCDLAKFIMAKEYTNIIEYDKEYQHLKYLYENQKKKYKMYQQALNSNIELHKLKRTSDMRPSTSNSTVSLNISKISLRSWNFWWIIITFFLHFLAQAKQSTLWFGIGCSSSYTRWKRKSSSKIRAKQRRNNKEIQQHFNRFMCYL